MSYAKPKAASQMIIRPKREVEPGVRCVKCESLVMGHAIFCFACLWSVERRP